MNNKIDLFLEKDCSIIKKEKILGYRVLKTFFAFLALYLRLIFCYCDQVFIGFLCDNSDKLMQLLSNNLLIAHVQENCLDSVYATAIVDIVCFSCAEKCIFYEFRKKKNKPVKTCPDSLIVFSWD